MTNDQALLKTKLDTTIDAVRSLITRFDFPLDTAIALSIAEAHLRHHRAVLEAQIAKG